MKRSFILLHCLFTFIAYGSEDQKIILDPIPENCQIAVTKQNPDHSGLLALMNPYQLRVMDLECNQFFVNKNKKLVFIS